MSLYSNSRDPRLEREREKKDKQKRLYFFYLYENSINRPRPLVAPHKIKPAVKPNYIKPIPLRIYRSWFKNRFWHRR